VREKIVGCGCFDKGEIVELKGMNFRVSKVDGQKLVLTYFGPADTINTLRGGDTVIDLKERLRETRLGKRVELAEPIKRKSEKVHRNQGCPCGSGKKFKACCMVVKHENG